MSSLECITPTNIRRSNRLYSYEEEKWDIKIQQEAELRHKQNLLQSNDIQKLIHSASLPKKLQEAIEIELARENATRSCMVKVCIVITVVLNSRDWHKKCGSKFYIPPKLNFTQEC